jgi:hypothetical protein
MSPAFGGVEENQMADEWVEKAVEALLLHPNANQEETLVLLERCGLTPYEAWRALQFLPIAFIHVVLREAGVVFQPGYVLFDPDSKTKTSHLLADEALYVAAVASAERWVAKGCTRQQLLPVFGRSAEYDVIRKLAGPDGRLNGITLTEPLLMTFGG